MTDAPFAVNLVLHFEQAERVAAVHRRARPGGDVLVGRAGAFLPTLHAAGCRVFVQVGSVADGRAAAAAGADALIAQGVEAGGHVESTRRWPSCHAA